MRRAQGAEQIGPGSPSPFPLCVIAHDRTFIVIFSLAYYLPLADPKVTSAIIEAFKLLQWYARNHTLACVVP